MTKGTLAGLAAIAALAVGIGAGGAGASGRAGSLAQVKAVLTSDQVVPKPATTNKGETGTFTATWDGKILRYSLVWKGLTGQATSAQIHVGIRKHAGPIAQPLCVPCLAPESGVVPLTAAQAAHLKAGHLYVSIQSMADPDGELRGQLVLGK